MFETILKNYLRQDGLKDGVLFLSEVEMSPDFLIDLVKVGENFYVIVRTDYLFMNTMVKDIQEQFPVRVEGWLRTLPHAQLGLASAELFKSPSVSEGSDEEWETYHQLVVEGEGWWEYAVLEVALNSGTTLADLQG